VAKWVGDIGYFGSMAYRLVDSAILPIVIWDSPDVAWQMSWIDLESFAIVAGVLWNVQVGVGRERPGYRNCPNSTSGSDVSCDDNSDNRFRSFIAGHVAVAAAGAGVTCLHHTHLPLYGGGFGDGFACAATIAATAAVGGARLVDQQHYASDVLMGATLGVVAGYVVPSALHYGFTRRGVVDVPRAARRNPPIVVSLVPLATPSTFGAAAMGMF
jgi:membrane-associated phospholipid phosphatase